MNRVPLIAVRTWIAAAATLAVSAVPPSLSHAAAISVVVLEGGAAPGIPGATFQSITDPRGTLNNVGQVAFAADLTIGVGGVTASNDQVIYRYSSGAGTTLIARGQDLIPALPGLSYDGSSPRYAGPESMNDAGVVAFYGGFGLGQSALFANGSIVRGAPGFQAPGLPVGITVSNLNVGGPTDARIGNPPPGSPPGVAGPVLYTVQLSGLGVIAGNNTALYRDNVPIAREGSIAPGTGDAFGNFAHVENARMNAFGSVAFTHDLATGGTASNGVVYRYNGSSLELLARDAAPAPGAPGEFFSGAGFFSPRINSVGQGQVAYLGELSNGDNVLYIDTMLYARDGMVAPGFPAVPALTLINVGGATTGGRVELNDSGVPLFVSGLQGPDVTSANNSVVYLGTNPIARTGSAAPIAGASFDSFSTGDLALNNLDQFALVAQLAGGGITTANDRALLMWDGARWHVVAREGDPLAGSLIAALVGTDGNPRIELNDASQVLFWANLADGRDGLFVTAAIPEPEMVWSLLAGLAVLGFQLSRGRRHRRA